MGSKAVIVCLLILVVAVVEIEGQTTKSCCKDTKGRVCFNVCSRTETPNLGCAVLCDCILTLSSRDCPASHPRGMLENFGRVSEYCKLGCESSLCNPITSLQQNSRVGEGAVKESVEHCKNACSELCNNGDKTELHALA